jgi:hypothetical protein
VSVNSIRVWPNRPADKIIQDLCAANLFSISGRMKDP